MVSRFFPRFNRVQHIQQPDAGAKQGSVISGYSPKWAALACALLVVGGVFVLSVSDVDVHASRRVSGPGNSCPAKPSSTFVDTVLSGTLKQGQPSHSALEIALDAALAIGHQCTSLTDIFSALRGRKGDSKAPRDVYHALVELHHLEAPLRMVMTVFKESAGELDGTASDDRHFDATRARRKLNNDLLTVLLEARQLATAFQDNSNIRRAYACYPDLLAGIEALVLGEESNLDQLRFGLYSSHLAIDDAPFFGTSAMRGSSLVLDAWESRVPEPVAKAEKLMLATKCESLDPSQAKEVALRLREHAQVFLATVDAVPVSTEVRYRAGAQCAAAAGLPKVASQLLARLAYFMSLRGRQSDALAIVDEALSHAHDPLAAHLQASLRLSLGDLRTDEDVRDAVSKLESAAGRMPPLGQLEQQRADLHSKLSFWGIIAASGGGIRGCFEQLGDVALLAICVVCRLIYG